MNHPVRAAGALAALVFLCWSARAGEPPEGKTYHMRGRKGLIKYTVKDRGVRGSDAQAVEVHYSRDGGRWTRYGVDRKLTGRMIFTAPGEGTFDFVTVAVDQAGNREKELGKDTAVEFRVVVDRTRPKVAARKESPAGDLNPPGGRVEYSWAAEDKHLIPGSVELQVRFGEEKTWSTVEKGLAAKGRKTFTLREVRSGIAEARFAARDRAGNRGEAPVGTVRFDRAPPVGRVTGPTTTASLNADVKYEVSDRGPAGLAEVALWITDDGGRTWRKAKERPSAGEDSVTVALPKPGSYGLALSARDAAGNELPPPRRGTKPQHVMLTDTAPPRLRLVNAGDLEGRAFSGAARMEIRWEAKDANLGAGPVRIEFSSDGGGKWTALARDLPNDKRPRDESYTGSHSVSFPKDVDSDSCLLRITVTDTAGNRKVHTTRPFTVDNKAPESSATFEPLADDDDDAGEPKKEPVKTKEPVRVSAPPAPTAAQLAAEAHKLLERNLRKQAAAKAAEALELDSESAAAHFTRGRALDGSDDFTASQHLLKALRLAPETEGLHNVLGPVSFRVGMKMLYRNRRADAEKHLRQAVKSFDKVLSKGKKTAQQHYNLGLALVRLSQVMDGPGETRQLAEHELLAAVKMAARDRNLQGDCHWWLATLKQDSREYRAAAKLWERAARLYGRKTNLGKRALDRARRAARRR